MEARTFVEMLKGVELSELAAALEEAGHDELAAIAYERCEDFGAAADCYSKIGRDADAGRCWFGAGDFVEAAEAFSKAGLWSKAAESYFEDDQVWEGIGCLVKAQNWEELIDYLDNFCHELDDLEAAAKLCKKNGLIEAAAKFLCRAYEQHDDPPESGMLAIEAAFLYESVDMWAEAAECWKHVSWAEGECIGVWSQAFGGASIPGPTTEVRIAECLEKAENMVEAAKYFERAGEISEAIRCLDAAEDWDAAAELCREVADLEQAVTYFERANDYGAAAECYEELGKWEAAAHAWSEKAAYEDWPQHQAPAYLNQARCLKKLEMWKEAAAAYIEAGSVDLSYAEDCFDDELPIWRYLAVECFTKANDLEGAADLLSDDDGDLREESVLEAGHLYEQLGKWDRAGECFEDVHGWADAVRCYAKGDDADGLGRSMAQLFLLLKRYQEAATWFARVEDWERAAINFEKTGSFRQAAHFFLKADMPEDAGRCLEASGDYSKAAEQYRSAGVRVLERSGWRSTDVQKTLMEEASLLLVRAHDLWKRVGDEGASQEAMNLLNGD